MIRITRTRSAPDVKAFTGAALQAKLQKLVQYFYEGGGTVDFQPKARQLWPKAKAQLKFESHGKCAYCEADTAVVAHGDVEHFRPKSRYWWLAYCYDNYAFSCQVCNQVYKSDSFGITGKRLAPPVLPAVAPANPAELMALVAGLCPDPATATDAFIGKLFGAERADLPHPYVDDPERLFAWKVIAPTQEVWLVVADTSTKARKAVKAAEEVLGLNRTELLRLRWNDYDQLETLALALQEGRFSDTNRQKLLSGLRRQAGSDRPFAAMRRYFLRAWGLI
jgi:hypothetical protein